MNLVERLRNCFGNKITVPTHSHRWEDTNRMKAIFERGITKNYVLQKCTCGDTRWDETW